jgi:hypothetical protein
MIPKADRCHWVSFVGFNLGPIDRALRDIPINRFWDAVSGPSLVRGVANPRCLG